MSGHGNDQTTGDEQARMTLTKKQAAMIREGHLEAQAGKGRDAGAVIQILREKLALEQTG